MDWRERASEALWKLRWSLRPAKRPNRHRLGSLGDELREEGESQGRFAASRWFKENIATSAEAMKLLFALRALERWWIPEGVLISWSDDDEIRRNLPSCPVSAQIEHRDEGIRGEETFIRILRHKGIPYYVGNSFLGDELHLSLAEAFQDGWDTALEAELVRRGRELIEAAGRSGAAQPKPPF